MYKNAYTLLYARNRDFAVSLGYVSTEDKERIIEMCRAPVGPTFIPDELGDYLIRIPPPPPLPEGWDSDEKQYKPFYKYLLEDLYQAKSVLKVDMPKEKNIYFLTIQYDKEKITIDTQKKISKKVYEYKDFEMLGAVNEKFREDGITYHTHFLFKSDLPKSKVIQFSYQFVKNFVVGKPSVDCRRIGDKNVASLETYQKYIKGDKKSEKVTNVEKDRIWRKENNFEF